TVSAFYEREDTFTFADAAFAADDDADAEDVDHASHFSRAGGEHHFECERGEVDELHRDERRLEHGNVHLFAGFEKLLVGMQIATEDNARDLEAQDHVVTFRSFIG